MFRLKSDFHKHTLFSGSEEELKDKVFNITTQNFSLRFTSSDLKPFLPDDLKHYIHEDLFQQILVSREFKKGRSVLGHFINASKLTVYYIPFKDEQQHTHHILLLAFGEINPGHFILEQEALLEATD